MVWRKLSTYCVLCFLVFCGVALQGCKLDPDVKAFKYIGKDMCKCEDLACALGVHERFLVARDQLRPRTLYWESAKAKRVKKPIEKSAREYWDCMNKLNPLPPVNAQCAADPGTHINPKACRVCCESKGRLYLPRSDRQDPKGKGCACR